MDNIKQVHYFAIVNHPNDNYSGTQEIILKKVSKIHKYLVNKPFSLFASALLTMLR